MGRHPKPLYGASVVKGHFFWPSASVNVRSFARAGPSLRPSAANPPFFCSTAPQAFFRPDRGLPPPSRADECQGWPRSEGSAFTSASTAACWLRRVDCSCCSSLLIAPSTMQARGGWDHGIEGSPHRGETDRAGNLVFGGSPWIRTMMHTCASAARLRGGGPNLHNGMRAMVSAGPRHLEPSSAVH